MALESIVIYGSSSFTARCIADQALCSGVQVYGVSRKNYRPVVGEKIIPSDEFSNSKFPTGTVGIYLAAPPGNVSPGEIHVAVEASISRFVEFFEKASNWGCRRVIYASSYWQFSPDGGRAPPTKIYTALKNAMDEVALYYAQQIQVVSLVLFDSYGPNDNRKKIWNLVYDASENKNAIRLTLGEQWIYPIFSSDLGQAFIAASTMPVRDGFNRYWAPGPERIQLREAINLYCSLHNLHPDIFWGGLDYPTDQIFDPYVGPLLPNWSAKIHPAVGFALI